MPRQMSFHRTILTSLAASTLLIGTAAAYAADPGKGAGEVKVFPGAQPIQHSAAPIEEQTVEEETPAAATESTTEPDPQLTELEKKEAEANRVASLNQNAASEHYFLGAHYFGKWDLNLAEIEFDQAVRFQPDLRAAHRDLCLVSLAKLNLPRSLAEFMMVTGLGDPVAYNDKEIADLNTRAKNLHYNKALDWANKQNYNETVSELQWAQKYGPEDPNVHHSLAYAYAAQGDFANAEAEYARTFAANPKDGSAHADYADLLAKKGELGQAQSEMAKAVKLAPSAAAYHVDLGWIAESQNDLHTATSEFEQAVKLSPKHAGLWEHFGRLLEKEGKLTDAEQAYKQALSLDPKLDAAQQDLQRLKQEQQKPQELIGAKQEA